MFAQAKKQLETRKIIKILSHPWFFGVWDAIKNPIEINWSLAMMKRVVILMLQQLHGQNVRSQIGRMLMHGLQELK